MMQKYLFICGAGRSGTTFLWKILNNSSQVSLAPEIHYFSSLYHNGFLSNYRKYFSEKKPASIIELRKCFNAGNHFGIFWDKHKEFIDSDLSIFFKDKPITEKNIYSYLMERDAYAGNKDKDALQFLGEKTPLNIFHISRLSKWFPESQFLIIYRKPIDVLKSEVNKKEKPDYFFKKSNPLYSMGITVFVFIEWFFAALLTIHNKKKLSTRLSIISYEQLRKRQPQTIKKICGAVGIQYTEDLCVYKKIGSSYSKLPISQQWEPPQPTNLLFSVFFRPFLHRLSKISITDTNDETDPK